MQNYIKYSLIALLLLPLQLLAGLTIKPFGFVYKNDTGAIVDIYFTRTILYDYSPATQLNRTYSSSHSGALAPGQTLSQIGWNERVDETPPCWEKVNFKFVRAVPRAVPNRAPSISWHTIPSSVNHGQTYYVRASGSDPDGNLQTIRVWKGSSAFAFTGVSGSSGVSSNNSTSDTGPRTVTFYAQAVDQKGATSAKISRNVTINAPPNHAPSVSWHTIPSSVNSGQSYVVRASGSDSDGNLQTIRVWKGSSAFAFTGVSGSSGVSDANSTSDTGPRTVTFYAQAVDRNGATSAKISRNVTINAPPNHAPSISWHTIPSSVASGQSYVVRASGSDSDGNLQTIRVWKGSSAFAFTGVSGSSGVSDANSTSDTGPRTVTFYAQAVDQKGATSAKISRNVTIQAPPTYSLSVRANSGGSASGSASGLAPGTRRSISASPSTGYHFSSWSKSGAGSIDSTSAASTAVTMGSGNMTVTANFTPNSYRLTVNSTSGGSASGGGNFAYNTAHNISASPASGYRFNGWSKSGPGSIANSSAASTSFTMGAGNATVTANFVANTYSLSVRANSGGSASGSASGLTPGTTRNISATPITGYQFTGWSKSGPGSIANSGAASTSFTMGAGNATLTANFTASSYRLTVIPSSGGSASGSGNFVYNTAHTISATPSAGYRFTGWAKSGPGSIDNASAAATAITMGEGNMTVTASFTLDRYNLTVRANSGGSASGSANSLTPGTTRSISATPITGYQFSGWSKSGPGSIANSGAASTSFTMGAGNATVTANFTASSYRLTVIPSSGGSASGSGNFVYNTAHTISATPSAGYSFSGWSKIAGPGAIANSSAASTSFTMGAGNATVIANFTPKTYRLTVKASTGGTASGSGNFAFHTTHPISASPATGYSFSGWSKSGPGTIVNSSAASTFFTIESGDATLTANFTPNSYRLTVNSTSGGTTSGSGNFAYNSAHPISASPAAGYAFSGWSKSGPGSIANSSAASTSFTMGAGNATVTANFNIQSYKVTLSATTGGTVTGAGTFVYNTTHPISAMPQTGYQFTGWTIISGPGAIASTAMPSTTFRVGAGPASIRANFAHIHYTLSVTSTAGGGATGSRSDAIYGGSYNISATPATNFRFTGWTKLSGTATIASTGSANTSVTMGANNVSVRASFVTMVQAPVSSSGGTITFGETFKPSVNGGTGSGDYLVSWDNQSTWVAPVKTGFPQAGSYRFYAKKAAQPGIYIESNIAGPYTVVVKKADQGPITSQGGYVQINDNFTVTASGGESSGGYQMSWDGGSSWIPVNDIKMTIGGDHVFYVRKLGDVNYNTSATSQPYTVNVLVPETRNIQARTEPTEAYKQWFKASETHSQAVDVLPYP